MARKTYVARHLQSFAKTLCFTSMLKLIVCGGRCDITRGHFLKLQASENK